MKFGISFNTAHYGVDPDMIVAVAQHAESLGFESFYMPEHVALYRGAAIGPIQIDPTVPIADPLESLSFVAAATERILLGTGVLLVPYQHPVVLAKRLATLDVLSKGRLRLLTVGVGALPGESAAVGIDFATRGRRADEAIDAMHALWAGDETGTSFVGEFYTFDDVCSYPKPHQASTLPIHVGGSSNAAARRAGLRGNGYFPGGRLTPEERAAQVELMRTTARDAGREPDALEYTRWGSLDLDADLVTARAAEGVDRLVVSSGATDLDEHLAELSTFADRVGLKPQVYAA